MSEAFPDACVTGYERLIPTMPEMGEDAHVLAAALHADADLMVTDNVKDFPPHVAPRFDIAVRTADDFLIELGRRDPRLVAGVVVEQSRATRRTWKIAEVRDHSRSGVRLALERLHTARVGVRSSA